MWFKNLQVFRLTKNFSEDSESLNEKLQAFAFTPCNKQQNQSTGWVPPSPLNKEQLSYSAGGNILLCFKKQEKILPAAVINEALNDKVSVLEEQEQRKLSRKEKNKLKDDITFELLPRAFSKSSLVQAYIAVNDDLLFINSSSATKAEELINAIREALGSFAVIPLSGKNANLQTMTLWLENQQAPEPFSFGSECELKDFQDESTVKYKNHDLFADEILSHIQSGHAVKQLELHWQDKLTCIIDDKFAIKRLKFSDYFQEQLNGNETGDAAAEFDADFALMTAEFKSFISDLVKAFGGYSDINNQLADEKIVAALKDD